MPIWSLPLATAAALDAASALIEHTFALIQGAYSRAPTLLLALTALLILPAVALISVAFELGRRHAIRRAAMQAAEQASLTGDMPDATGLPMRSQAWLTVEGGGGTVALAGQVARIGRHRSNDLRLADRSVHRHHAVIERTPDEAFVIVDLSGKDGSGVRINGQRAERMQLSDGDVIELGRAKLKFEMLLHEDIHIGSRHPVEIEG